MSNEIIRVVCTITSTPDENPDYSTDTVTGLRIIARFYRAHRLTGQVMATVMHKP